MLLFELFIDYWRWHYSTAIKNIFSIWGDFIWFLWNYFSVGQLARTLFVPWKRLRENSTTGISDLFNFFSSIVITLLMRIVGAIMRLIVIFVGVTSLLIMIVSGIIFLICWILLPVLLALTFAVGISLLIKNTKTQ